MTIELILAAANNQINKVYECLIRGDNVNFKENFTVILLFTKLQFADIKV